jgi:hypothetical protein
MFWKKKSSDTAQAEKMPGPQPVTESVIKTLSAEWKLDPEVAKLLKMAVHRNASGPASMRIFDESDCLANGVQVKTFATLDERADLILFEGTFDEGTKKVELAEKKKASLDVPILSEQEILQKIEGLTQPGSTVFFYQAQGSQHGGPLGMGATIIELNPAFPGKKQKKYNVYGSDVVNMQPVNQSQKMFDSDKAKELAKWVKTGLHKRWYS